MQQTVKIYTGTWTGSLLGPTGYCDVDDSAALSGSRLAPVHTVIQRVSITNKAVRSIPFPPTRPPAFLIFVRRRVSLYPPVRGGGFVIRAAQRERLVVKELGSVGNHSQNGWKKQEEWKILKVCSRCKTSLGFFFSGQSTLKHHLLQYRQDIECF